jgi:hypothetical protein
MKWFAWEERGLGSFFNMSAGSGFGMASFLGFRLQVHTMVESGADFVWQNANPAAGGQNLHPIRRPEHHI